MKNYLQTIVVILAILIGALGYLAKPTLNLNAVTDQGGLSAMIFDGAVAVTDQGGLSATAPYAVAVTDQGGLSAG